MEHQYIVTPTASLCSLVVTLKLRVRQVVSSTLVSGRSFESNEKWEERMSESWGYPQLLRPDLKYNYN